MFKNKITVVGRISHVCPYCIMIECGPNTLQFKVPDSLSNRVHNISAGRPLAKITGHVYNNGHVDKLVADCIRYYPHTWEVRVIFQSVTNHMMQQLANLTDNPEDVYWLASPRGYKLCVASTMSNPFDAAKDVGETIYNLGYTFDSVEVSEPVWVEPQLVKLKASK